MVDFFGPPCKPTLIRPRNMSFIEITKWLNSFAIGLYGTRNMALCQLETISGFEWTLPIICQRSSYDVSNFVRDTKSAAPCMLQSLHRESSVTGLNKIPIIKGGGDTLRARKSINKLPICHNFLRTRRECEVSFVKSPKRNGI